MADLDGFDSEFDAWLQVQRAHEPAQTLREALVTANRCLASEDPRRAANIVSQVQRLDPCSEEATRLAMRIADQLGDRALLHRQFDMLRDQLQADYGSTPSRDTIALFERLAASDPSTVIPQGQTPEAAASPASALSSPPAPDRSRAKRWLMVVAIMAIGLVALLAWFRQSRSVAPTAPPLVTVLPFDRQSDTPDALAEGLWDDTRLALSQGRAVRVLGRTTSLELDQRPPDPRALHKRLGVDYLLEGGVRRQGDRVRIVVSLTRASDGVSIWEHSFDGRIGDPMALQFAVAQGIEGRIRGRLAPGGGVHARQIATSPEVYALYSEARALIRQRGRPQMLAAAGKLRQAVTLDPNFAPAWASLASAAVINRFTPQDTSRDRAEAVANARRAIDLAPSLAEGYAALALVEGEALPSSERYLKRAIALDPSNAEAWNWLGNSYSKRRMLREAIDAYERAIAIDPYYTSPMSNMLANLFDSGRETQATALVERVAAKVPDKGFADIARSEVLLYQGDYSAAAALLMSAKPSDRWYLQKRQRLGEIMLRLGYAEEAGRLWHQPPRFAPQLRGEMLPSLTVEGRTIGARDFWLTPRFPHVASRAMLHLGRPDLVVRQYRDGFRDRADFVAATFAADTLDTAGQLLAVALRRVGNDAEANAILTEIDGQLRDQLSKSPYSSTTMWDLARVRAQLGDKQEAVRLITAGHRRGWLPDGHRQPIDLAREPAFEPLRTNSRFEAIRQRILAHVARERRELGQVAL